MKYLTLTQTLSLLLLASCRQGKTVEAQASGVTAEMALEGVNKYCHDEYDWSVADGNPGMMNVTVGDETETEYKVVFRSYTGSFEIVTALPDVTTITVTDEVFATTVYAAEKGATLNNYLTNYMKYMLMCDISKDKQVNPTDVSAIAASYRY